MTTLFSSTRRTIFAGFFFLIYNTVASQTGNVGIGTETPTEKLEINNGSILVNSGGGTPGAFAVKCNTYASAQGTPLIQNQGNLRLLVSSATGNRGIDFARGGSVDMVIDNNGNVGIGTTAPSAKLAVWNGNISVSNGGVYSNTGYWGDALRTNWGNDLLLQSSYSGKSIVFHTSTGEKMRIDAAGNVGIGITTPAYKLDVAGNTNIAGQIRIQGGSPGAGKVLTSDTSGLASWATVSGSIPALVTKDDFSGTPFKNFWQTQITGAATVMVSNSNAILATNGANTAILYSVVQRSVAEGTLVFTAVCKTYEDNNTAYGPLVRGLVNGTSRNNAIEFINTSGSSIQARTVSGGVATTTNYAIGASVDNYYSYTIIASAQKAEFYFNGLLIATHTTNIPVAALNMYFDASTPGGNVPHYVDDATFELVK